MNVIRRLLNVLVFVGSAVAMAAVNAQACTYNEALLAFQQGNLVRGFALLTMAAKDGDRRAAALFSALQSDIKQGIDYNSTEKMHIVLTEIENLLKK